jgi:hypothetical protein
MDSRVRTGMSLPINSRGTIKKSYSLYFEKEVGQASGLLLEHKLNNMKSKSFSAVEIAWW